MDYQDILAKCYVAMSEVDYELDMWLFEANESRFKNEIYNETILRRRNGQDQRGP